MTDEQITSFTGEHRFLSNFYMRSFSWRDRWWRSSEHAFQASKMTTDSDYLLVANAKTPGEAKRLGRLLICRRDWDSIKLVVMEDILRAKFADPVMSSMLLATGSTTLIEGNTWGDTFWGQCPIGSGTNHLGEILMTIRSSYHD